MKRRQFVLSALSVGGALVIGWGFMPPRSRLGDADMLGPGGSGIALNGWVRIAGDGSAVLAMPRAEMGQGVHTALPMLLAEELELPLERIRLEQAPSERIYANVAMVFGFLPIHPRDREPGAESRAVRLAEWLTAKIGREVGLIATGGSSSVADAWESVRGAGAHAREAMREAAARRWGYPVSEIRFEQGALSHRAGLRAGFAEFAAAAAALPGIVAEPKPRTAWRLIGTAAARLDIPAKIDGSARFGLDTRLPGMCYAAVVMCPVIGGRIARLDVDAVRRSPGVDRVVRLPADFGSTEGFAVVADNYWNARQAANRADVDWAQATERAPSTDSHRAALLTALDSGPGFAFHSRGSVEDAFAGGGAVIASVYEAPHLAHATMEPINATASVREGRVEIWAPTQVPDLARLAASRAAGVGVDDVDLHVTLLGGGFGRRLDVDFIAQAARVALETRGRPVQLIWSREQDTTHDFYRPGQAARLEAVLDERRRPRGLRIRSAGDSVVGQFSRRLLPCLPAALPDRTSSEGLFDQPYGIDHQRVEHVSVSSAIPIGFWRSVGHSHNAFFLESFIDELAAAAGVDPYRYRHELLGHAPRHRRVLAAAAERGDWHRPVTSGRARGIALHESFGSIVAQVVEVSADGGRPRVHRVACAIDCGTVVNPGIVAQQVEGSVIFGLTAALFGRIDIDDGRVRQQNFPDYRMLSLSEAPIVDTVILASERAPAGVGEPATPPLAPALANAWFRLTGDRVRRLPIVAG